MIIELDEADISSVIDLVEKYCMKLKASISYLESRLIFVLRLTNEFPIELYTALR